MSTVSISKTALFLTIKSVYHKYSLHVKTDLFQAIQFTMSTVSISKTALFLTIKSVYHKYSLHVKTDLFQAIQFRISMQFRYQNSSILNNSG